MTDNYVSIILPTYNRSAMIAESIQSVLLQTYPYFELIVVDDASEDNTEQVVKSFKDERIIYIKLETNSGPSIARNVGIKRAQYNYIAFEDSDDLWLPQKLEKQMPLFNENIGLVYCAYRYESPGYSFRVPSDHRPLTELSGNIFDSLWRQNAIGTPTMVIKKECLQQVGMFSESIKSLEDWELVLRIAKRYEITFLNEVLVSAKYSTTGVNHNRVERIRSILYLMEEFKSKERKTDHMLDYVFSDLALLADEELAYWKGEIVPNYVADNSLFDLLLNMKKQNQILSNNGNILECFCNQIEFEKFLKAHLLSHDVVGIYGMGILGRSLVRRLRQSGVKAEYLIDRREIDVDGVKTWKPEDLKGRNIDKIFITVSGQYESIVKTLEKYICTDFINVDEILQK